MISPPLFKLTIVGLIASIGTLIFPVTPSYKVTRVIDGDTIKVKKIESKKEITVRLACIDAPELNQDYGEESKTVLELLVDDRDVVLDISSSDRYGRKIAQVYLIEGEKLHNVNVDMVLLGAAHYYSTYKRGCKNNQQEYDQAEETARSRRKGLWRALNPQRPWDWRRQR